MRDSEQWTKNLDPEHLAEYEQRVRRLLTSFGMSEYDRKMKVLSGGEIKRAAIIVMLASEADFFVMDEPTNHLDIDGIEFLENYLSPYIFIKATIRTIWRRGRNASKTTMPRRTRSRIYSGGNWNGCTLVRAPGPERPSTARTLSTS